MIRFLLVLAGAAAFMVMVALWMVSNGVLNHLPSFFYQTLIFVGFSTAVIFGYLYKAHKPSVFVLLFLFTMALKLLASGAYVVVIILQDRSAAIENVVVFLIAYFVFSALEIGFLYHKISRESKA